MWRVEKGVITISKILDLTGKQFEYLLVVAKGDDYISPSGLHYARWLCKCICGNTTLVRSCDLMSGKTTSCGCRHREIVAKRNTSNAIKVEYTFFDKIVIGHIPTTDIEFVIDKSDYDRIKSYRWTGIKNRSGSYYIGARFRDREKQSTILLHRLIMNCPNGMVVDHINHNTLDNRKQNLRVCTRSENNYNRQCSYKSNIYLDKRINKWIARIGVDNQIIYLGSYDTYEEALEAREKAEKQYYKYYSYNTSKQISQHT